MKIFRRTDSIKTKERFSTSKKDTFVSNSFIVKNVNELLTQLQVCDRENKLLFIKAGAPWCSICRNVTPTFRDLSDTWVEERSCKFLEFDVDETPALTRYFGVKKIPYFVCLLPQKRPGLTVKELTHYGGDITSLKSWIQNIFSKWPKIILTSIPTEKGASRTIARIDHQDSGKKNQVH